MKNVFKTRWAPVAGAGLWLGMATGCATTEAPKPVAVAPVTQVVKEPTAEERFSNGVRAANAKDWPTAKDEFSKSLEKKPDSAAAAYDLGYADSQMGDNAGAIAAYEKAHQLDPKNTQAVLNLGKLYREQEKYDRAIAIYEESLKANPYDVNLLNNVSVLYRLDKQYEKAEAALRKLLSRTKDNPEAYKTWRWSTTTRASTAWPRPSAPTPRSSIPKTRASSTTWAISTSSSATSAPPSPTSRRRSPSTPPTLRPR